jgi:arylsulfatase A-like enzyme
MSHYAIHAPWETDDRFLSNYADEKLSDFQTKYATMIEGMDKSLGDLMDWLDQNNLAENTLVIFMTDNGQPKQAPRNLPLRGSKLTPYEGGTRVPMIIRWPKVEFSGWPASIPIMIEDLMPTVLGAAQIQMPENLPQTVDGLNFFPLLGSQNLWSEDPVGAEHLHQQLTNRDLIWHFPHTYDGPPYSAIRRGDWKLIYWYADDRVELYNLADDISEIYNLADAYTNKATELQTALQDRLQERGALLPKINRGTKQ